MTEYRRRTPTEATHLRDTVGLRRAYPQVTGKPHIFTVLGHQWVCKLSRLPFPGSFDLHPLA